MTYTELSNIKTQGFITNNVIDDAVSTARWGHTKAAFKKATVSQSDLAKITFWAEKEGVTFSSLVAR